MKRKTKANFEAIRAELLEVHARISFIQEGVDDLRADLVSLRRQVVADFTDHGARLKELAHDHRPEANTQGRIAMLIRTIHHMEQRLNNLVSNQPVPFVPPEPTTPNKEWEGVDGLPE